MEIGIGLDNSLGLSLHEEALAAEEATKLGYTSIWTPDSTGYDPFIRCQFRWNASRKAKSSGITTGISVSPIALRTPLSLAMSAGTMSVLTHNRFILGIGSGNTHLKSGRKAYGLPNVSSLELARDYLIVIQGLLGGKTVNYKSPSVTLVEASLDLGSPLDTPVFLGALGPKMLRLAGEHADGAALNWCSVDQVAWSRGKLNEGALLAKRDPSKIKLHEYIRVCIDEDIDLAKRTFAKSVMQYALGPTNPSSKATRFGYRAHFERMGFKDILTRLDTMRANGSSQDAMANAFPEDLLRQIGYFGPPDKAADAFSKLSSGLDTAVVRIVPARRGLSSTINSMRACKPELITG